MGNDVRGYPSIKYGDPTDLKDYNGGRSFEELKKFAEENLGPSCGPDNIDLCDEEKKALIEKFQAMDVDTLKKEIEQAQATLDKIDAKHEKLIKAVSAKITANSELLEAEKQK